MKLDDLNGEYQLRRYGDTLVCCGPDVYMFHLDGSLIAHRPDLRNVHAQMISENKLITYSGRNGSTILSLKDGTDLQHIDGPAADLSGKFAASPCQTILYYLFERRDHKHLLIWNLDTNATNLCRLNFGVIATKDIICGDDGCVYLLQTRNKLPESGDPFDDVERVAENYIIRLKNFGQRSCTQEVAHFWYSEYEERACYFWREPRCVLCEDLSTYHAARQEREQHVEINSHLIWRKTWPHTHWLESDRYLFLTYLDHCICVDLHQKAVIARYKGDHFVTGCLLNGEFACFEVNQLCRKPFPFIEDFHEKNIWLNPWRIGQP